MGFEALRRWLAHGPRPKQVDAGDGTAHYIPGFQVPTDGLYFG
jgi:hypothetical protein